MLHTHGSSTQETEAGGLLWVWSQPGKHNKFEAKFKLPSEMLSCREQGMNKQTIVDSSLLLKTKALFDSAPK